MGKYTSKIESKFSILNIESACESGHLNDLPKFCQTILNTASGKIICCQVMTKIRKLIKDCGAFPFIYCCHGGAKVLVIPTRQNINIVYCRSPLCDLKHLKNVAELFDLEYEKVLDLWNKLPWFGASFVDKVLLELGDQIGSDVKKSTGRIGKAYSHFEFDIAITNALASIPTNDNHCQGFLKMDIASANKESHVIRVVTKQVGASSLERLPPIIGLVFESDGLHKLEQSLNSQSLKDLGDSLLGQWSEYKPNHISSFGNGRWKVHTNLFADATPTSSWITRTEIAIIVGFHVGSQNARKYLMEELVANGSERFLQRLSQFSDSDVLPLSPLSVGERPIYWQQIIEDFLLALEKIPHQNKSFILQTIPKRIDRLLEFGEEYPLLTPAVKYSDDEQDTLQDLLLQYLLNGEALLGDRSQYIIMLESDIIREDMNRNGNTWEQHFYHSPYATVEALFKDIKLKRINVSDRSYKQLFAELFKKCERLELKAVKKHVANHLYDMISTTTTKVIDETYPSFIGGICTAASFGIVDGYSVADNLRSKKRQSRVDNFIEDISRDGKEKLGRDGKEKPENVL